MSEPTEALTTGPDEGKKKKKKGGLMRLLVMLLPMTLLPAGAGAYLAYGHYPSLARTAAAFGIKKGLQDEAQHAAPAAQEFGQFKVIPDLLVNPAGTNGKRFLMVHVGLESPEETVFAEVDTKDAVIRDIILQRLGRRTVEELSSVTAREQLKEELRVAINGVLSGGSISRLYFTQFILQ